MSKNDWINMNHERSIELIKDVAICASELEFGEGWDSMPRNQDLLDNIKESIDLYFEQLSVTKESNDG